MSSAPAGFSPERATNPLTPANFYSLRSTENRILCDLEERVEFSFVLDGRQRSVTGSDDGLGSCAIDHRVQTRVQPFAAMKGSTNRSGE